MRMDRLIKDSETIVVGEVIKMESRWEEHNNIWTLVTLKCKDFLKGTNKSQIIVRVPGGKIGNKEQGVSGTPKYQVGETVLNFLGKDSEDMYFVNGWEDGKYTLKDGQWIQKNFQYSNQLISTVKNIIKNQSK